MNKCKGHTEPGWYVHEPTETDHRLMVLHPDGERLIADCSTGYVSTGLGAISTEERLANAHLIAVAPRLLWALEFVALNHHEGDGDLDDVVQKALAEAHGENHG